MRPPGFGVAEALYGSGRSSHLRAARIAQGLRASCRWLHMVETRREPAASDLYGLHGRVCAVETRARFVNKPGPER
jgi:hypothetical protein